MLPIRPLSELCRLAPWLRVGGAAFAMRAGGALAGLALQLLLARALSADGLGLYAWVMGIVFVGAALAQLGLRHLLVRFLPEYRSRGEEATSAGLLTFCSRLVVASSAVAAGVVALALCFGQSSVAPPERGWLMAGALLAVWPLAAVAVEQGVLRAVGRSSAAIASEFLLTPALSAVVLLALSNAGALSPGAAVSGTAAAAFGTLVASRLMRRRALPLATREQRSERPRWLRMVPQVAALAAVTMGIGQVDVIALGSFSSFEQAGVARVALAVAQVVGWSQLVASAIAPRLIAQYHYEERPRELQRTATRTALAMGAASALLALLVAGAAPHLLSLFGGEFVAATGLVRYLCAVYAFDALFGLAPQILLMTDRGGHTLLGLVAHLLLKVTALLVLLPSQGLWAVGHAALLGFAARNFFYWFAIRRELAVEPTVFGALMRRR